MKDKVKGLLIVLILLLLMALVACGSSTTSEEVDEINEEQQTNDQDNVNETKVDYGIDELVISFTPEADPINLELEKDGLASYLADELGIKVKAQVDADYTATVEAMRAGHAHIATNLSPVQAALANKMANAHLVLKEERNGQSFYHSKFWVLKDSGMETIEDLEGKTVAFNDPLSGSGYLMPVAKLISEGLAEDADDLHNFFSQVYFAGGTELSLRALIEGTVDVAGVSENGPGVFLTEEEREKITYVAQSDPMPRHAIAVSGELPDELVGKITEAFLKLNEAEYNELLQGLYGWTKVVPADVELYLPLIDKAQNAGILGE
ncbi:phosphonate transport system substrate-binding protein [Evansella vedderi]|uniref:Phosphonate transport system substrate-binding protein n=1 Tax=Evansella vedderi TaxID=38282 RepID=A0ABU0A4W9_9BACI|nr:phosphate/phosphite/phosphonate ABC transporter substrate-binding protein [Evansella vedderi]MDQ0257723.1 phosphonate transport system substrate-binding protein [Evansella vedderi]